MTKPDPSTVALDSPKGQQRAARIQARVDFLAGQSHFSTKALGSALSWALARLGFLESRKPKISQAQAVAIIEAWVAKGSPTDLDGTVFVLDGLELEDLGIG